MLDYEKLANRLIDDRIDLFGYANTLNYLVDMGCSEEDLLKLGFDREDAVKALNEEE